MNIYEVAMKNYPHLTEEILVQERNIEQHAIIFNTLNHVNIKELTVQTPVPGVIIFTGTVYDNDEIKKVCPNIIEGYKYQLHPTFMLTDLDEEYFYNVKIIVE